VEVASLTNQSDIADADGTVSLILSWAVVDQGDGTSILATAPFGSSIGLCTDQPFYNQRMSAAHCSGFLVSPDVIATANHCLEDENGTPLSPGDIRFVFGFELYDDGALRTRISNDQIYYGVSVRASNADRDWALVNIDRPVTDHNVLPIRRSGTVAVNTQVNIVGHPVGLPAKHSGPAPVTIVDTGSGLFATVTDGNRGNSGSPVINDSNHEVEGILIAGPGNGYPDNPTRGCKEELRCNNDGSGNQDCMPIVNTLTSNFRSRVQNYCSASYGGWKACRGSGCSVCSDAFNASYYDLYFQNHPNCSLNTTCNGSHSTCNAACPEPSAIDTSSGSSNSQKACRGSGIYVCEEKVAGYPHYFDNHPQCQPNASCKGGYYNCSEACPAPTQADRKFATSNGS
jgi:V8-like Glu-specific endopeptidase